MEEAIRQLSREAHRDDCSREAYKQYYMALEAKIAWMEQEAHAASITIERLREALRPDNKLIGDIAHILTGLCNSLCCRKTGGYFEANCECRDVATEIAELYTARAALGEGK